MHPSQSSNTSSLPNLLPKEPKRKHRKRIHTQHRRSKRTGNDSRISMFKDPVEETETHAEGDGLFSQVHDDEHFGYVGVVGVHRVCLQR